MSSCSGFASTETETSVLVPLLGEELASRKFYPLEEQRYKNMVKIKKQPTQQAMIKILENPPQIARIRTVNPFPRDINGESRVKQLSYQHQSAYYLPKEKIEALIQAKAESLEKGEIVEFENFREPKSNKKLPPPNDLDT